MKRLKDAFVHRQIGPPYSALELMRRFEHVPPESLAATLRKAGPFIAERDGYPFENDNPPWAISEEDACVLRERFQPYIEPVAILGIGAVRTALMGLSFSGFSLPLAVVDLVINEISGTLRNELLDMVVSSIPGRFGRCGGMAFSALDFFLVGWPVDSFTVQPRSGELRQYIWNRLLDSLDLNALTFLEWLMALHIMPVISQIASAALGAAVGSLAGPIGIALGALVAGNEDVLGLGGPDAILVKTREHFEQLRTKLDHEAAWPIGLLYSGSPSPIDQHQVLALKYGYNAPNAPWLTIWDNNDGATFRHLNLDFRGEQLVVAGYNIIGIICEEYTPALPPHSLRR